ncbi:MAG: hypothetical protein M3P08_05015 [Thermoproteota archaeon]|nr:hypothetical protein [Thermoproteota archaeon]
MPVKVSAKTEEILFCNYDLISSIRKRTISSLIPIYTGVIPEDQIDLFVKWLRHARRIGEGRCHTPAVPCTDLTDPYFSHLTYWLGQYELDNMVRPLEIYYTEKLQNR